MRPLQLTMQAFGSYGKRTGIDFTETRQNMFLITGDTGAGKTTIFDAIVFALYGEASSGNNRKDGIELQSQFAGTAVEPYVELRFSEQRGGETDIYTVRRIPRHLRPLRRGRGQKEEKEKVSLILPDGTEYAQNQKQTDAKLEEIVGLTKSQFMQVAMIAQGEFMELLRAKSDEKKLIFRKLFNTGLYQDIVDELGRRRQEQKAGMDQLRAAMQNEISHVVIPELQTNIGEMAQRKKKLLSSDRIEVTEAEAFLEELQELCGELKNRQDEEKAARTEAEIKRDACRDALTQGQELLQSFKQRETAERELAACAAAEEQMREKRRLAVKIEAAYEVQSVAQRYEDAAKTVKDTEQKLQETEQVLPERQAACEQAEAQETAAKQLLDAEAERCTRTEERVHQALDIFQKLREAEEQRQTAEAALTQARKAAERAETARTQFEEQEQNWRRQAEELGDVEARRERWKSRQRETEELAAQAEAVRKAARRVRTQEQTARKAAITYEEARQKYQQTSGDYERKQRLFLDAQAGFLARERLRPGEPCPVCGATEHPHPCELAEEHRELTRAEIEALAGEVTEKQQAMEKASAVSGAAAELLREKQNQWKKEKDILQEKFERCVRESGVSFPERSDGEVLPTQETETWIADRQRALREEEEVLTQDASVLVRIQKSLAGADERRKTLREQCEKCTQAVTQAERELTAARTTLNSLQERQEYPSEQEAKRDLARAGAKRDEMDAAWQTAKKQAQRARSVRERAEVLLARYQRELPEQRDVMLQRRKEYQNALTEGNLSETAWRETVGTYPKSLIRKLQDEVAEHGKRQAAARARRETAEAAIAGRERPEPGVLREALNRAEELYREKQSVYETIHRTLQTDTEVRDALTVQLRERAGRMREYARLDSLYERLAGKRTGSRMDMETYVQRYYLQRILRAANVRFHEMSAGQFALRMVDAERAGEGKNRGLDLMVYSQVTGKEREVRTLSGGESFLAALSLALGMADQIQESSASVHLDMMFIDEGFGSLDEHSRSQAVKVLQQMAGGSKLIGIISHVSELKQEIEDQLLVTKGDDGSHASWQG
ncbi:MAG: SMC family ATPase [Lachnospiraceae bacterium]|nr:SMC family ATPase [Lachnospiraceae bacterium]